MTSAEPDVRVMTQNVLCGGGERLDGLVDVLAGARPDVLVLQECQGWTTASLAKVGQTLGLAHTRLALARPRPSGARYHLALLSRWPVRRWDVCADPSEHAHALLDATVDAPGGPLRVLGAHFDGHGEALRLREATRVIARLSLAASPGARAVLAGDLNALSRHDPWPPDLDARLRSAGVTKYGSPPAFDTMDALLAAGWVDTLAGRAPGGPWATAVRGPPGARVETRTDFVLASPALAAACVEARIVDVGASSDHHGVLACFHVGDAPV